MVGDVWGMDGSNLVVIRAAKAASIGTGTADSDSTINNQGQHHRRQQYQRPRRTSRSSTTQSPNSQLPSIGLINNLRTAIDPQSQVEVPRHQARRSLTPRVDKKSTHARCGGDRYGVSLSVRGEFRRGKCAYGRPRKRPGNSHCDCGVRWLARDPQPPASRPGGAFSSEYCA